MFNDSSFKAHVIESAESEPPPAYLEKACIPWGGLRKDFCNLFPLSFHCIMVVFGRVGHV